MNPEAEIQAVHAQIAAALEAEGVVSTELAEGRLRLQTLLYMIYWFHRLRNNSEEQARIRENLAQYLGASVTNPFELAEKLFTNSSLVEPATRYVEHLLTPIKTVDLVITKLETEKAEEILCAERSYYPFGLALPGGIIRDEDEDNDLGLSPTVFAALRVAGEKVLGIKEGIRYGRGNDNAGHSFFTARGEEELPVVRLHSEDEGGYRFRENIKAVLRPSDPRHIVDTVGFKCEIAGEPAKGLVWKDTPSIMSLENPAGGFAFGHHREIVAHIIAQTSVEKEIKMREREFIRFLVREPLESYRALRDRFATAPHPPDASFKELFPVVNRLLTDAFSEDVNALCEQIPVLAGVRDKAVISLRHVSLKNRTFCPYTATLRAIAEGIAFFDVIARQKKGFYETMPKDRSVEHDPGQTKYASYHMYRYKYRLDQLMTMIPEEIFVPTYETLSTADLMYVRSVPIRFLGLSKEFLYVDEFEQSPEEFFMHDCNHSWRMIMEDRAAEKKYGKSRDTLIEESATFTRDYLNQIKIRAADTEEERELKKIKKIILFEIVHEDARPFLKQVIGEYIQVKEGGPVPFEVPRIDPKTGYMDVVDTIDTGISTLSYVRNKLQHGFYDHVDAQLPQIVSPKYRTAEWIARTAYRMLIELDATPVRGAELDEHGHVSYEWLLRRACAAGPDNIHGTDAVDPAVGEYGDGAEKLNPKRYQAGT